MRTLDGSNLRAIHREVNEAVEKKLPFSSSRLAESDRDRRKGQRFARDGLVEKLWLHAGKPEEESAAAANGLVEEIRESWTRDNLQRLDDEELIDLDYRAMRYRDSKNVRYVLYETAGERMERSNDGSDKMVTRDKGHKGWTLIDFWQLGQAQRCHLLIEEVTARFLSSALLVGFSASRSSIHSYPLSHHSGGCPTAVHDEHLYAHQ